MKNTGQLMSLKPSYRIRFMWEIQNGVVSTQKAQHNPIIEKDLWDKKEKVMQARSYTPQKNHPNTSSHHILH